MITSYPSIVTSQCREGLEMKEEEKKGGEMKGGGERGEERRPPISLASPFREF